MNTDNPAREIIVYKGLPASGKTTHAMKIVSKYVNVKRVCKDDLRSMLDNDKYCKANERFVIEVRNKIIWQAMEEGKAVIVDDTNLNPVHIKCFEEMVELFNSTVETEKEYTIRIKFFDVPVEDCIVRDKKRKNPVGEKVIRGMYEKYLTKDNIRNPPMLEQDKSLPKIIICDIDGTIARATNRGWYDYDKVKDDEEIVPITDLLSLIEFDTNYVAYYVSGREDSCRDETISWLEKKGLWDGDWKTGYNKLFMRKAGDPRKDAVVKKEIYENHIKDKYYVVYVFDDRNQTVKMWRELGLTCLQVANGDF